MNGEDISREIYVCVAAKHEYIHSKTALDDIGPKREVRREEGFLSLVQWKRRTLAEEGWAAVENQRPQALLLIGVCAPSR